MERLIRILRAAHCRSTHQFFVVDALPLVSTVAGQRLSSQFLRHHTRYLVGAKAPDKEFRDFRNHVIHVNDNHWGGAPKLAEDWYAQLVYEIRQSQWSEAAYCAGVLSHYFTDPLMPLHTEQSTRESVLHRPLEWSVTKSYEKILKRYRQGDHKIVFDIAKEEGWLGTAVIRGAEHSNRYYHELMDRYDLAKGSRRPVEGFDGASIDILAGLFGLALTGWARIVERAAEDAGVEIPQAPLSLAGLVAAINMPVAWVVRRIESAEERKAVRAIFEEFKATGTVIENLPDEVRTVSQERRRDRAVEKTGLSSALKRAPAAVPVNTMPQSVAKQSPLTSVPATVSLPNTEEGDRAERPGLGMSDDLVDAPSIGPKTAKRFEKIGISTVEQFLKSSPESMAKKIKTRWIKADTIRDWQDQARLVSTVAALCGYKAQLLVGVECRDAGSLAAERAAALHSKIEQFASTSAGKRALRSSDVPSLDDVGSWIESAATASLKRSA